MVSIFCTTLEFIVILKIIGELPARFPRNSIQILGDIQLADPNFWTLESMEMIIGEEIFYQLIRPGQVKQESNLPLLFQNTLLGDNGTNFIGANRILGEFLNNNSLRKGILEYSHQEGIDWRNFPPHAPHFGALWEAGVISTKYHLRRCIGDSYLILRSYIQY